jgi:hypothetical protein
MANQGRQQERVKQRHSGVSEQLSSFGIPVLMMDIKGILAV